MTRWFFCFTRPASEAGPRVLHRPHLMVPADPATTLHPFPGNAGSMQLRHFKKTVEVGLSFYAWSCQCHMQSTRIQLKVMLNAEFSDVLANNWTLCRHFAITKVVAKRLQLKIYCNVNQCTSSTCVLEKCLIDYIMYYIICEMPAEENTRWTTLYLVTSA